VTGLFPWIQVLTPKREDMFHRLGGEGGTDGKSKVVGMGQMFIQCMQEEEKSEWSQTAELQAKAAMAAIRAGAVPFRTSLQIVPPFLLGCYTARAIETLNPASLQKEGILRIL
jgi:hypothetical protein